MIYTLQLRCPASACQGYLHPVEVGEAATVVVDRKCRRCGAVWRLKASPLATLARGRAFAHRLDWTCLEGATKRCGQCGGAHASDTHG